MTRRLAILIACLMPALFALPVPLALAAGDDCPTPGVPPVATDASAGAPPAAVPDAPPHYVRRETWAETLRASREALARHEGSAGGRTPLPDFGRSAFTIAAWVRTTEGGTIFAKAPAKGKWAAQGKTFFIRGGRLAFDVGWVGALAGRTPVADGRWHHVALAAGDELCLYVDGRMDQRGRLGYGPDAPGHVAKVGFTCDNFPDRSGLAGDLDDLRVYARCLSDEEVRLLAQAADAGQASQAARDGLVGHWPFEDGGADASGCGNNAADFAAAASVDGRIGRAARFAGKGGLVLPGDAAARRDALWARVARDFADETSAREMAWEREDGIWQADWPAGDAAALALRYAAACRRTPSLADEARRLAAAVGDDAGLARVRGVYLESRRLDAALARAGDLNLGALRGAIDYLAATYPQRYPRAGEFSERLAGLERNLAAAAGQGAPTADGLAALAAQVEALRREALVTASPLFDFDRLVFVKRRTYQSNHYYTDFINGCRYFGGNLCVLSLKDGKVTDLAPSMAEGIFDRYDVSFDGRRAVFGWKRDIDTGFSLFEVGADGAGLRQLTFPPANEAEIVREYRVTSEYPHGTDDMHPCYLPDGGICFISTRCRYGILCDPPDNFTTTVLYRVDADGRRMEKLTNSSVSEASPVVMDDGRILYTRWEYVDKGAVSVKCLWAVKPDGTASVEVYGNDLSLPPTLIHGRPIPGRADEFVVLGTPHCPQNRVGTVILLDTSRDIRTRDPMTYVTPQVDVRAEGGFHARRGEDWVHTQTGPLYTDPYPLDGRFLLVSHNPDRPWNDPTAYGLYLLDTFGNCVPLYRDAETSCWQPMPLRPRLVPPVLASGRDDSLAARGLAQVAVTDVYHNLEGVARGTVKYLRILEQAPRPWSARRRWPGDVYDQQHPVISKDTHLGLKVLHGVAPVEADGSAHFVVPADKNIFLQALDERYMAVQTERTYVNYRPGEARACVGCHETPDRATPPAGAGLPLALRRGPSVPQAQPGDAAASRPLHYPTDVQPLLDKHCVRCHGGKEPKAGMDLSGTMTDLFCVSYENLVPERRGGRGRRGPDLIGPTIGENHPKTGNVHYLPARSLGSHASVLVAMLNPDWVSLADASQARRAAELAKVHGPEVRLTTEERIRLTTFVDTNAQYYGSYFGRRSLEHKDHPDFRPVPTLESALGTPPPVQMTRQGAP
jgi:hypothetical protein